MKPDSRRTRPDVIERAHLKDPDDASHVMHRYPAPMEFDGFLQRFWIPVWSVPPGLEAPQRVLQYPVALVVVAQDYARFYGVVPGLSTTTLSGAGWAFGVMCAPAAGALIAGGPMSAYTDRHVDVADVLGVAGEELTARVRAAMATDPHAAESHAVGMAAFGDALRPLLPVDDDGRLVNEVVAFVEGDSEVTRVAQVCERFGLSERALQRLVHRRLGLTPKWLIQRRRLQEAAERLRDGSAALGEVAAVLGYADQAHFTRDFARVTAMTPGQFAARHAPGR
ncbi:helix-turn-helix transcriptional regulator [Blastococcus sp. TF02A-35]|uniref:helix-turn-helix domain-containing protein n=1 Tax=Blastococcus sp. TF02A-35 TaxID=2559612 RepID=UPI001074644D|nr:helix-turn-helix transcriptional regulator [Blastococcus sp. TF02A_35]TFV50282.1 AraC family transcriptional regulator [Blastococcus sp. TF02A_35]